MKKEMDYEEDRICPQIKLAYRDIKNLLAPKDQEKRQAKEEVINFKINYYHPGGTPDEVKEEKKKILKFLNKDLWKKKLNHY